MNPTRLAEEGAAFDRRLVHASRREVPPDGAEARALVALGLTALTAAAESPPAGPTLVDAWKVKAIGALLAALVGVGVAVSVTGSRHGAVPAPRSVAEVPPPPPPSDATHQGSSSEATPAPERSPVPIAPAPVPRASPQTHVPTHSSPPKPPPPVAASSGADPTVTALSGELTLIRRATQALAIQDPVGALAVLSTYGSRYPHGTLAAEAGYLRVQALLAEGDRGAAIDLARRLLAADPRAVLAPKLRASVESEPIP